MGLLDLIKKKPAAPVKFATYEPADGNDVTLYATSSNTGATTDGAWSDLAAAIQAAESFIFIADWSFQPYVRIQPATPADVSQTVGNLLIQRAKSKAGMLVAIHTWDHTNIGAADPQNDNGNTRLDAIAGGLRPPNVLWRASSRSGFGWSFHQKFVVLDAPGSDGRKVVKVFYGGLDLTKGRWDFLDHPIDPNLPPMQVLRQRLVHGNMVYDDWYNAEFGSKSAKSKNGNPGQDGGPGDPDFPRQAWQDYYAQLVGPAAWDVVREFVGRWNVVTGSVSGPMGDTSENAVKLVLDKFKSIFDKGAFKQQWEGGSGPFKAQVVRSMKREHWGSPTTLTVVPGAGAVPVPVDVDTPAPNGSARREFTWQLGKPLEKSIEERYVRAIGVAENFIYVETQYFIGSGAQWEDKYTAVANRIPESIVKRICDKIDKGQDFHAYIVIPMFPEGDPVSAPIPFQRYFEWQTMQYMAKAVATEANKNGKSWDDYLSFYFVGNWSNRDNFGTLVGDRATRVKANWRYMSYVHSKLMIVDDRILILGSANLNERSLAGDRDGEICVAIEPTEGQRDACVSTIQGLRRSVWTALLGGTPDDFATPQTQTCVHWMRDHGQTNWKNMRAARSSDGKARLVAFPFAADEKNFYLQTISDGDLRLEDPYIFDAEAAPAAQFVAGTVIDSKWDWSSPSQWLTPSSWRLGAELAE